MYATYELKLYSGAGQPIRTIADYTSLSYARTVNTPGSAVLVIPYTAAAWQEMPPESILEIWRRGQRGVAWRAGGTHWLLTRRDLVLAADGHWTISATFTDLLDLLRRWLVAYPAGSAQSAKTGAAETVIKAFVTDELITRSAALGVNLGNYITIEGDAGRGQTVNVEGSWQDVASVCSNVAQSSAQLGTYVAYDFEVLGMLSYLFRVYTGQRGTDRSPTAPLPLQIIVESGAVAAATYTMDYSGSATYVWAGGQKTGGAQVYATASDASRESYGPFAHREMYGSAQNTVDSAVLTSQAKDLLREYRPAGDFTVQALVLGAGLEFGVNVKLGDLVSVRYGPLDFLAALEGISVTVDGSSGLETVSSTLRYVGSL